MNKQCQNCGTIWYPSIITCICGRTKFTPTHKSWKVKPVKIDCNFCSLSFANNSTLENHVFKIHQQVKLEI